MGKIYYYKLTADNGGAPCVEKELLSLAICKPRIRMGADEKDWIFGFAANSLDPNNRLIYIAEVTGKERDGRYYKESQFTGRGDRIYARVGDRYEWRPRALYHGFDDVSRDLGPHPDYPRAQVLLSDNFRYLGVSGTSQYKAMYPLIKNAVERLGQGERVNHPERLREELISLKNTVWGRFRSKVCGKPHQPSDHKACHRTRSCGFIDDPSRC